MRAYIAILKDSFREAMASRVLWIALIGIGVVLLLIAPFGLRTEKATELRRSEVTRPENILKALIAGANEKATPAGHIWTLLTAEQKRQIERLLNPDPNQGNEGRGGNNLQRELVNSLNKLLGNPDVYDKASWAEITVPAEATDLIAQGKLGPNSLKRRNLLLLAAAFPRFIVVTESNAISLTYAGATLVDSIPLTPSQFEVVFETAVVRVLNVFLGFFGIFASLLVTAGLIPRTFEPGEIALLLSKPVNRGWLYVTKFLGGCTFTLMYSCALVTGIWFLLGVRMHFWRIELLWCIPVYVFLFMIYFSVSALAGAIWRNSTVALSIVVVFWLGITVTEIAKQGLEDNLVRSRGIKEITMAGDELLMIDGDKKTHVWNTKTSAWDEVFREPPGAMQGFIGRLMAGNRRFSLVFDPATQQILALQATQGRFGGMVAPELIAGSADDDWERISLGRAPEIVDSVLIDNAGRILLPADGAIYEYIGQTDQQKKQSGFLGNISGGLLGGGKAFHPLKVNDYPKLGETNSSALNHTTNQILIFSEGVLYRLDPTEDGGYSLAKSVNLETEKQAILAAAGKHCILGLGDGQIIIVNCETLDVVERTSADSSAVPRVSMAAADGSWLAALRHDENVVLYDGATGRKIDWGPAENGACTAIASSADGGLLVSDGRLAVRMYDVKSQSQTAEWSQQTSWVYRFFDLAVYPLWSALPKPSQLDDFVPYVMSGEDSVLVNEARSRPGIVDRESLQQERETFEYKKVFRDNAVFVLIMLALGCIYVSRSDF